MTDKTASKKSASTLCRDICAELQRRRVLLKWTQQEVADKSQLSLKYVGEIERGEGNVRLGTLERIATTVGWTALNGGLDKTRIPVKVKKALRCEVGLLRDCIDTLRDRIDAIEIWLEAVDEVSAEASAAAEAPPLMAPTSMTDGPRIRKRRKS